MANVGDILPHCTGTGISSDPYKYSTAEGFKEAIAVQGAYVEAAVENLVFDANDGVISAPVTFSSLSCKGKGTTIRNLCANKTDTVLVQPSAYGASSSVTIDGVNFYNMLILVSDTAGRNAKMFKPAASSGGRPFYIINCNFTGVYKGTTSYIEYGLFDSMRGGGITNNIYWSNCTFNISIDANWSQNANPSSIFFSSASDAATFTNCTFCFSGKILRGGTNREVRLFYDIKLDSCTVMNSSTNPLTITDQCQLVVRLLSGSGYNYFKIYANGQTSNPSTFYLTQNYGYNLLNISRISGFSYSGSWISMQETDPTASDYIYNTENLANAGFLVGTVIE